MTTAEAAVVIVAMVCVTVIVLATLRARRKSGRSSASEGD